MPSYHDDHDHDHVLRWDSVTYSDGCRYEGLVKGEKRHVRGVTRYAGGDRYEGEYHNNMMYGVGAYIWSSGAIYRGEWKDDQMHGCGVVLTPQQGGRIHAQEGEWLEDQLIGDGMTCSLRDARDYAAMADQAALSAQQYEVGGGRGNHHPAGNSGGRGGGVDLKFTSLSLGPGRRWGGAAGRWLRRGRR